MSNNKGSRPDYSRYMDTKEGWVDRRIFWEREIYEQELEQIFAKAWQFIAHDSMLPETNDFYTTYMGEDCVYSLTHAHTAAIKFVTPMTVIHEILPVTTTAGLSAQTAN